MKYNAVMTGWWDIYNISQKLKILMNYIFEEDSEIDLINNQSRPKSVFETEHSFKVGLNTYLPV